MRESRLTKLLGWWYICIGLGFALLGARYLIAGSGLWPVALRGLIAVGFLALGAGTLRARKRN
jgi:hypothetical protein